MHRFPLLLPLLILVAACAPQEEEQAHSATLYEADGFVIEAVTTEQLTQRVVEVDADFVVVNFWASWCAPCREEFPELIRLDRDIDDVAVRFVSLDFEEDVSFAAEFLHGQNVRGTTFLKTGPQAGFIESVSPAWTGAIPATAIYTRDGRQLLFWEGKVDYETLVARVDEARTLI